MGGGWVCTEGDVNVLLSVGTVNSIENSQQLPISQMHELSIVRKKTLRDVRRRTACLLEVRDVGIALCSALV